MRTRVYGKERQARQAFITHASPAVGSSMTQEEFNALKFKACVDELKQRGMTIAEIEELLNGGQ